MLTSPRNTPYQSNGDIALVNDHLALHSYGSRCLGEVEDNRTLHHADRKFLAQYQVAPDRAHTSTDMSVFGDLGTDSTVSCNQSRVQLQDLGLAVLHIYSDVALQ